MNPILTPILEINPKLDGQNVSVIKFKTKSNYLIQVSQVQPHLLAELREKYRLNRGTFKLQYHSKELGGIIPVSYSPPKELVRREDSEEAWANQQAYQSWVEEYNLDYEQYCVDRNKLLVVRGVKVLSRLGGKHNWKYIMDNGHWANDLMAAGIEVSNVNRYLLFLKAEILEDETDYLKALSHASVEEVTLEGVLGAFDYFWLVLERSEVVKSIPELARWRQSITDVLLGRANGHVSGQDSGGMVLDTAQ